MFNLLLVGQSSLYVIGPASLDHFSVRGSATDLGHRNHRGVNSNPFKEEEEEEEEEARLAQKRV